jgi:hypothetical protein
MKYSLIALCLLIFNTSINAVEFSFTADTLTKTSKATREIFKATIKNLSNESVSFTVVKSSQNLPENWTTSICVGERCFPPFADTVIAGLLEANETASIELDIDTDGKTQGVAKIDLSVYPIDKPAEAIKKTFTLTSDYSPVRNYQAGKRPLQINRNAQKMLSLNDNRIISSKNQKVFNLNGSAIKTSSGSKGCYIIKSSLRK